MQLTEICIKRPVFTIVLSLILILVGVIGYQRLPVRELPNVNRPVVMIKTVFTGASPSLIESQITNPIEEAVSSISGLRAIKSKSRQGSSFVILHFKLGTDINEAANDVRNKVARIERSLPKEAEKPEVFKSDPDSAETVILSVTSTRQSAMALTDYVNRYIKPQLERISGVASIDLFGDRTYAMRVWLDPWKMALHHVTTDDIKQVLQQQNANVPGGQIKSRSRYYNVLTQAKLQTAQGFNNLIIRDEKGYLIRIGDVGHAEVAPENIDTAMRVDGKPAIGIGVVAQATANPVKVANRVAHTVKEMQKSLPLGMQVKVIYNNANFVHASLYNVKRAVIEAIILVIIVVLLFLGSWRSTAVPIVTIPICLISVFGFIYIMGYSINIITLLALVLAIGLVVDDAIVMLENIYRHVEAGMKPFAAAIKGSKQIAFAIIAMTITLAAVYAPIGFSRGMTGIIFRQFAFTLAATVIISGFVALTLSPMMCARMLVRHDKENFYSQFLNRSLNKLISGYKKLLNLALCRRFMVVLLLVLLAAFGYWLYKSLPAMLAPVEDTGAFRDIIIAPTGASFSYTNHYAKQIEKLFEKIPEEKTYMMMVGYPSAAKAFAWVVLKPWSKRKRSEQQIMQQLTKEMRQISGVRSFAVSPTTLGGHSKEGSGIRFIIMTTGSYKQLYETTQRIEAAADKYPGFRGIRSDLKMNNEEFKVWINRNLAASLKVNVADIADTIATMMGGSTVTTFESGDQSYDVIVQMKRKHRRDLHDLDQLYVRSETGKMIPLSSLVKIKAVVGPLELPHYDRLRSATMYAELKPGYSMSKGVHFLQNLAKQTLPEDTHYTFTGAAERMLESRHTMAIAFVLALIFIYLVLAAQFESFIDPLIILFSVPLSIVGALFTLKLAGGSLNIYSNIGFVTLVGLIAKHGILITEFANQLRASGHKLHEAVVEAAALRLRPILMTTAAMVIGAIPLVFASGAGAASRHQIGWVIVGGMLFGTFFSLFVVPVAYTYLAGFKSINVHRYVGGKAEVKS